MGGETFKSSTRLVLVLLFAGGCAAKQRVALDCVPHEVSVYVDGRRLEGSADSVELRADRPHTVFFKGGDYEPRMIVLEPHEVGDPTILTTRALREGLRRVRLCILREGHVGDGEGASRAPSVTPIPAGSDSPEA